MNIGRSIPCGCLCAVLLASTAPGPVPRDLEVGVPPGSPTAWARWIPAVTPRREPLFPRTAPRTPVDPTRTVVNWPRARIDPQIGGAGMLRITTADVTGHLTWVNGPPAPKGPITGPAGAKLPAASPTLQWIGTAAFLRLLLHRQQVSEAEIIAHLVELGEPALWSVDAALAEPSLREVAGAIRTRVEPDHFGTAQPAGADPRERMLLRFVTEELGRAHPYDPEGGFGLRLFVFAADVEPLLIRLLHTDADPFLVRNATAALGRYRTPTAQDALTGIVAVTKDPVVLMRALAALEPGCRAQRLLDRLDGNKDPVEVAALVAALGRIGAAEALTPIVARARHGLRSDPDLLMTALVALCRLPVGAAERELPALANAVRRAAQTSGERFQVGTPASGPQPDRPDTGGLRGEILAQLGLLLDLHCSAEAKDLAQLQDIMKGPRTARRGAARRSPANCWPPVQLPLVETLARLGEPGLTLLRATVDDGSCDPVVRVAALSQLPGSERDAVAERLLTAPAATTPSELRLAAVQVLDLDGGAALLDGGRTILRDAARTQPDLATTSQRSLWLAVVQALDRRSALRADDLLPLLDHVRQAPRHGAGATAALRTEVLALAEKLVADVSRRLRGKALDARVAELVDLVIASRTDRRITPTSRDATLQYVRGLLAELPKQRGNAPYQATVVRAVADYLVPDQSMELLAGRGEVHAVVPFEEAVLLALGHTQDPTAVQAIAALLARPDLTRRSAACLAAAATGDRTLLQPLLRALLDDDGFVRFCAYEALRHLTGRDVWADWMYGDAAERGAAAQMWFRICSKADK